MILQFWGRDGWSSPSSKYTPGMLKFVYIFTCLLFGPPRNQICIENAHWDILVANPPPFPLLVFDQSDRYI